MNLNSYYGIHMQQFLHANPGGRLEGGGSVVAGEQAVVATNMQRCVVVLAESM